jgi:hypothetical protein
MSDWIFFLKVHHAESLEVAEFRQSLIWTGFLGFLFSVCKGECKSIAAGRAQKVGRTAITGVTCAGSLLGQVDQGDPTQNMGDSCSLMKMSL